MGTLSESVLARVRATVALPVGNYLEKNARLKRDWAEILGQEYRVVNTGHDSGLGGTAACAAATFLETVAERDLLLPVARILFRAGVVHCQPDRRPIQLANHNEVCFFQNRVKWLWYGEHIVSQFFGRLLFQLLQPRELEAYAFQMQREHDAEKDFCILFHAHVFRKRTFLRAYEEAFGELWVTARLRYIIELIEPKTLRKRASCLPFSV